MQHTGLASHQNKKHLFALQKIAQVFFSIYTVAARYYPRYAH